MRFYGCTLKFTRIIVKTFIPRAIDLIQNRVDSLAGEILQYGLAQ